MISQKTYLRTYESRDRNGILQLFRMNTPAFFAPEEERDLAHYLDHEIEEYYVLVPQGELIGSGGINYSPDRKTGIISWDILHPAHQGKGWGRHLLEYRLSLLIAKEDIHSIIVRTSQLVFPFYEKQGFRLVQIKKDYWAPGLDLCYMEYQKT